MLCCLFACKASSQSKKAAKGQSGNMVASDGVLQSYPNCIQWLQKLPAGSVAWLSATGPNDLPSLHILFSKRATGDWDVRLFDYSRGQAYVGALALESNGNLAGFVETDAAWLTAARPDAERVRLRLQPSVNGRASEVIWTPQGLVNTIYPAKHDTAHYLIRQGRTERFATDWLTIKTEGQVLTPNQWQPDYQSAIEAQLDWSSYADQLLKANPAIPGAANMPLKGSDRISFALIPHFVSHRVMSLARVATDQREANGALVSQEALVFDRLEQLPMPLDHVLDPTPACIQYIAQRVVADAGLAVPPAAWVASPSNYQQFLLNPMGVVWLLPSPDEPTPTHALHGSFISWDDLHYNGCLLQSSRLQLLGMRAP
jgi:hypothetical protein